MEKDKTIKALLDFVIDTRDGFYGDRVKIDVPARMADPHVHASEFVDILLEYVSINYSGRATIFELEVTTQFSRDVKDKITVNIISGNKVNRELFSKNKSIERGRN